MNRKMIFVVVGILIVGTIGFFVWKSQQSPDVTIVVHPSDFLQQVSVSGKVIATENLDLSFEQSGRITSVAGKVGDTVYAGQVLASQDTSQLSAQLSEIQSNIDLQKAKLNQFLSGSSSEDLMVLQTAISNAETSVTNAKTSVENAKQNFVDVLKDSYTKGDDVVLNKADQMFGSPHTANAKLNIVSTDTALKMDIEIQRTYIEDLLKSWKTSSTTITTDADLKLFIAEAKTNLDSLKSFFEKLSLIVNNPSSCKDSYTNSCDSIPSTWKTDISMGRSTIITASNNVTTAEGTYQTALSTLKTAEGNLQTAQNQLAVKKAPPRQSDISVYEAQVKQAEASKQDVLAQLYKKQIRSPIHGVITVFDGKIGKIAGSNETIVTIINSGAFEIESYVPEKNLPFIQVGNSAIVTLDAYGSDVPFSTTVISIDPAETLRDGVTTYRVLLQFSGQDERVRPGMTANVLIETEKKSNVISVPQGIIETNQGQKMIKIKDGDSISLRVVQTGSVSSLGTIEIVSGLKDGEVVVLKEGGK